jgi:predicted DNA binding CopG/RHH family protein
MSGDRRESLLDRDWSDVWEALPEAPPLVPRPKTAQITLRVSPSLVSRLRAVATARSLPYHALARSWIVDGLRNPSALGTTATAEEDPQSEQLNIKLDQDVLDQLKARSDQLRRPYHRLAREWIEAAVTREEGSLGLDPTPDHPVFKADAPPSDDTSSAREPIRGLEVFSDLQRQLAATDFTALTAAQHAIAQATAFKIPEILAAQDAVAKHFAQTIDFSRLASTHKALIDVGALSGAATAQTQWATSLARAVDFSALYQAIGSSAAVTAFAATGRALTETLKQQTDSFAKVADNFRFDLPFIEIPKWIEALDRWIPPNLRGLADLDAVAVVALDEGIPLSWVPRSEIVVAVVSASTRDERQSILIERTNEILDDCQASLAPYVNEWEVQCKNAIGALRAGFDAPAQSLAGNIVDSIVLALYGKHGREETKKLATATEFDDLPLQLAAENLTLRPLFRAFTSWWPTSGDTPPDHFARHTTAHAVGHVGVFTPLSALVAVMLATSLTVQYSPDDSAHTEAA